MIKLKNQIHFCDIYEEVADCFKEDKPKFIKLFQNNIDLNILIPNSFFNAYYASTGHPRDYSLSSMLIALIIQKILGLSETKTFLNILNLSSELKSLCNFSKVPHESQFSRFKCDFITHIMIFFNTLVDITEPICKQLNSALSKIIIADTTGIEAYVKENNPKFFESLLRVGKSIKKKDSKIKSQKYACSKIPKQTYANPDIKLSYINGHFCYALKATTLVNGLGIIRHIDFNYKYFLGDSAYDCDDNYKYLAKDHNMVPIICLNPRNSSDLPQPSGFSSNGTPLCPRTRIFL